MQTVMETDALGGAWLTAPSAGAQTAFGGPQDSLSNSFGTLLTGKRDDAGTFYRRNRAYDPITGRFTQEDPAGLAGGLNAYAYADGDPVNFRDPYGLATWHISPPPADDCGGLEACFGFAISPQDPEGSGASAGGGGPSIGPPTALQCVGSTVRAMVSAAQDIAVVAAVTAAVTAAAAVTGATAVTIGAAGLAAGLVVAGGLDIAGAGAAAYLRKTVKGAMVKAGLGGEIPHGFWANVRDLLPGHGIPDTLNALKTCYYAGQAHPN
jgi:RHS repeat-associated protein